MLKLYNTLTKQKEEFKPINPGKVSLYSCGPTVYDYIHLGNVKSYLTADILRRYLEYIGLEVRHIKNVTDVGHLTEDDVAQGDSGEDKIGKKALKEKKTPEEIARFYEEKFKETEEEMNILPAQYFPRATAHIPQMIKMIERLIEKGLAYEKNGNVFFDVTKAPNYGELSGNTLENLKTGARLEEHPDKKNPWDFALWLKAPKEHLMKWDSPWGVGYPGWHIECSAMSMEYLGDTLDIHTGGEDNIFPHHEAEIAQSEGATGKKFVNFWVHTRHLLGEGGEKMSKSKGNFITLKEIEEKGYSFSELRLALISNHYRSQNSFSWKTLDQARANFKRISDWINNLKEIDSQSETAEKINLENYQSRFEEAMNDDLNTPLALSVIYELISETNKKIAEKKLSKEEATSILNFWERVNKVFGLKFSSQKESIPEDIQNLAQQRKVAKANQDFALADKIREELIQKGYEIQDQDNNEFKIIKKHA